MALTDTAIFLIFLASLIVAVALLFSLRKFTQDCKEKKRKAKVCETTKIDKDDYKKRKFDLDLECGRSVDSDEKRKAAKDWWDSSESLDRKDNKAGRGVRYEADGKKGEESVTAPSLTSSAGTGSEKQIESELNSMDNEIDNATYTHVTSALEGVSPKTLENNHDFDDIPLGSQQCKDMLDEWERKKW